MKTALNGSDLCAIAEHLKVVSEMGAQQPIPEKIAEEMTDAILKDGKVLRCGNGGSAADSQHPAAKFAGRVRRERGSTQFIFLTANKSTLTRKEAKQRSAFTLAFTGGGAIARVADAVICVPASDAAYRQETKREEVIAKDTVR